MLKIGGLGLCGVLDHSKILSLIATAQEKQGGSQPSPDTAVFSADDEQFLDELEKRNFQFFWEQASPQTGLIRDRCNVQANDNSVVASIAATGFGLTALCIADKRGFVLRAEARDRVLLTLRFLWKKMPTHRGFFYHFADINTGERVWDSEVSSVDTSILLCGILTCRRHFPEHSEISLLAYEIFNRVDWSWLSEDTSLLPHGWTPEGGFLPYRWDYYSEMMMIYLLGLGSLIHPLPTEAWNAWKRTKFEFDGVGYIGSFAPLFVHQYSQAWFDFRNKRDAYANYFKNSALATDAHRRFCLELAKQFPDYSDDLWGISASDSQKGYVIWGGPPMIGPVDGTVVPSAPAGSLPFLPQAVMRVLKNIKDHYEKAWSRYGFVNAFNPLKNWYDSDVVGIDTGITMLAAENARSSFVWDTFMKNPEAQRGMERAGFKKE
ncbi:MAG TPA: glucoamylase family protein [Candidatus Eremiobacteraceae bacterium]|nr:glucoamylase family protein [Candidatus Eremiobacteraceae bacterium]